MDIVVIFNGLGNQMSQYAFYLSKKKCTDNCQLIFDDKSKNSHNGFELEKVFGIKIQSGIINFVLRKVYNIRRTHLARILNLIGIHIVRENVNYDYDNRFLQLSNKKGLNYYWGGWHSEKYFKAIKEEIVSSFKFDISEEKDMAFLSFKNQIDNTNSVSLHVRRGDYITKDPHSYYQYDGIATLDYYKKAIKKIESMLNKELVFFVFSNDIEWCKDNFKGERFVFVDCNNREKSWRDLYMMTICKHHIVANSSFSWWGAWLCSYEESITICPDRFLKTAVIKDFYPEHWIKIDTL